MASVRLALASRFHVVVKPIAAAAAGACLLAPSLTASAVAAQGSNPTAPGPLTQSALSAVLAEGVRTRQVPTALSPALSAAKNDVSLAWQLGCLLGHDATTDSKPCVFGDTTSRTTVVLFGDSHAAAWFSGINTVSLQEHWRLVFMGKMGCPTVSDVLVKRINGQWYHQCVTWRHNMERQIIRLHPNLLVIASSDYVGRAQPDVGRFSSHHRKTWLNGVSATFKTLRHAADHVALIANVPHLKQPAYQCVADHQANVFPCTMPLSQAFQWPNVRQRELQLAAANGIAGIDPAPWFCTATRCPVIANKILIFRDSQHITPEWSNYLSPMLADSLVPLLDPAVPVAPSAPVLG